MCDKEVCERWCVTKRWRTGGEAEDGRYRSKNKNPTQTCGEIFVFKMHSSRTMVVIRVKMGQIPGRKPTLEKKVGYIPVLKHYITY